MKKEDGNYINFAISGMLLFAIFIILYFFEFRIQINSLENHITTGVQMAEDSILSASSPTTLKDKEKDRFHIIINPYVNEEDISNSDLTFNELNQINWLTDYYLSQIKSTFFLDDKNHPTSGELKNLQYGGIGTLEVSNFTIWETVYTDEITTTKFDTHNSNNVKYFIKYDVLISNNKRSENAITEKVYLPNSAKIKGKNIEGSTIDSTIKTSVYLNNVMKKNGLMGVPISKDVQMNIVSAMHDSRKQ